jgi:mannose-6-phosphate isomerase-like protein (cupin superfamily)
MTTENQLHTTSANQRQISVKAAMSRLPNPEGKRFATVLEHGSLSVEIYAPQQVDLQQPHSRDEAYVVVQGNGEFINGESRQPFGPGDFIFVPAGIEHRFINFSDDLIVWVIFYGPEGGQREESKQGID